MSTTTSRNVNAKGSAVSEVKAGTDSAEGTDLLKENSSPTDATTTVVAPGTEPITGTLLYSRGGHSRGNSSVSHYNRGGGYSGNSSSSTGCRSSSSSTTTNNNKNNDYTRSNDRAYSEVVSGGLPARKLSSVRETSPSRVGASRDTPLSHAAEALFRFRYTPRDQDTDTANNTHQQHSGPGRAADRRSGSRTCKQCQQPTVDQSESRQATSAPEFTG